jgi:hypothetical protein
MNDLRHTPAVPERPKINQNMVYDPETATLYGEGPTLPKGADFGSLEDLRDTAHILDGLIEALDEMSDRLGPDGTPLFAIIVSARPLAARIARGLDDITTAGADA